MSLSLSRLMNFLILFSAPFCWEGGVGVWLGGSLAAGQGQPTRMEYTCKLMMHNNGMWNLPCLTNNLLPWHISDKDKYLQLCRVSHSWKPLDSISSGSTQNWDQWAALAYNSFSVSQAWAYLILLQGSSFTRALDAKWQELLWYFTLLMAV